MKLQILIIPAIVDLTTAPAFAGQKEIGQVRVAMPNGDHKKGIVTIEDSQADRPREKETRAELLYSSSIVIDGVDYSISNAPNYVGDYGTTDMICQLAGNFKSGTVGFAGNPSSSIIFSKTMYQGEKHDVKNAKFHVNTGSKMRAIKEIRCSDYKRTSIDDQDPLPGGG